MKIQRVDAFAIHIDRHYRVGGKDHQPAALATTPYYFEPTWRQVYATKLMGCLVKITTDNGLVGWGEAQAPIAPEVVGTIIEQLVGPALIGHDPLANVENYDMLYHMMNVRGHHEGFMVDALAGVDIALWDIKGKHFGVPVSALLGGPAVADIPAYVSGLRQPTLQQQVAAAKDYVSQGFAGIKMFLPNRGNETVAMVVAIREAVGPHCKLMVDMLWGYDLPGIIRFAQATQAQQLEYIEAPLPPEAIDQHVQLAAAVDVPIAIGENFRTSFSFRPWLESGAAHIVQPDVARAGITECLRIAGLARSFGRPITWHVGTCFPVAMAASWHLAAAGNPTLMQEHQADLFATVNTVLHEPLRCAAGKLVVPTGPGLGVHVNEARVRELAVAQYTAEAV